MTQTAQIQPQAEEKSAKVDVGLFLQLPYILIDKTDLSDSAYRGFINLCRQFLQKDKTITFRGSYRELAAYIQQSRMTCYRSVEQWVTAGLIIKTETADGFILEGDLSILWAKNAEHCKAHQRPKLGHQASTSASQIGTRKTQQRPNFSTAASQTNHSSVPNWDKFEREMGDIYTGIYTLGYTSFGDTLFGASDTTPTGTATPTGEKSSSSYSREGTTQQKPGSHWLQETPSHEQGKVVPPTSPAQQALFPVVVQPTQPKGAMLAAHVTPKAPVVQQPATPASTQPAFVINARAVEAERKKIEKHLWEIMKQEAGTPINRNYANNLMPTIIDEYMSGDYRDEDFIKAVRLVREAKKTFSITNVSEKLPDAVLARKGKPLPVSLEEKRRQVEAARPQESRGPRLHYAQPAPQRLPVLNGPLVSNML